MKAIYFVGIGGIGMSALARYFKTRGLQVGGYDKTPSPLTEALSKEGIAIHYTDDISQVDNVFKDATECMVCYTPAIPANHGELNWFRQHGFQVCKRSVVLGEVSKDVPSICVAGTHGKTTTSSMIAHILKQSQQDCNAILGGILKPYQTNLLLAKDQEKTHWLVLEADEFDRSFHTLRPTVSVITSCDPDHLDIYGTEEAYRESFAHYVSLVNPTEGFLLKHQGIKVDCSRLPAGAKYAEYGVVSSESDTQSLPDFYATHVRIGEGTILFDFVVKATGERITDIEIGVPAPINVENATAALAVCTHCGVSIVEMKRGLKTFEGARRRFDFYIKTPSLVLIDDYAHHPEEIRNSLRSIRALYKGHHLTLCFQPHLFTRTRDFVNDFAEVLSMADRTILLPIYPAREQPLEGVTSEWLLGKIQSVDKCLLPKTELVDRLVALRTAGQLDVVVMMGAGVDIERLVPEAAARLSSTLPQ